MTRDAVLSDEDPPVYRYTLTREWEPAPRMMVWIMLNPSTADHQVDDPTIQACMGFARRNGCGGICVVNLFAFRSSSPAVMRQALDPVGPRNNTILKQVLTRAVRSGGTVVAGWGNGGDHLGRAHEVARLCHQWGVDLKCFATTQAGWPRHPLARGAHRIPADAPLRPLDLPEPLARPLNPKGSFDR